MQAIQTATKPAELNAAGLGKTEDADAGDLRRSGGHGGAAAEGLSQRAEVSDHGRAGAAQRFAQRVPAGAGVLAAEAAGCPRAVVHRARREPGGRHARPGADHGLRQARLHRLSRRRRWLGPAAGADQSHHPSLPPDSPSNRRPRRPSRPSPWRTPSRWTRCRSTNFSSSSPPAINKPPTRCGAPSRASRSRSRARSSARPRTSLQLAATVDDIQNNKADVELTFEAPIAASLMPKQGAMSKVQGTPVSLRREPVHDSHEQWRIYRCRRPSAPARKPPVRKKP